MKPKVLLAVPNTGYIHKDVTIAIIRLLQDSRVKSTLILPTRSPTVENRHRIMHDFLNGDYDYLISLDSDNPPTRNIIDLVFYDLDIVGCPTPVWANILRGDYPIYWNAMDKKDDGFKQHVPSSNGLEEVDAVGTGCIVIARRVLEKLQNSLPFIDEYNSKGFREVGHDYGFCTRAKEAGFKVYAHFGYSCKHFNELELTEVISAMHDHNTLLSSDLSDDEQKLMDSSEFPKNFDKIDFINVRNHLRNNNYSECSVFGPKVVKDLFALYVPHEKHPDLKDDRSIMYVDASFKDGLDSINDFDDVIVANVKNNGVTKLFEGWTSTQLHSKNGMIIFSK